MMKKDKTIGEILGIQQEDMAQILKVTRSQWSMYVLGKRDLPIASKLKLVEMLTFVKQLNTEGDDALTPIKEESKIKKFIEEQLIINKHKQGITEAKLKTHKKKYEEAITAWKLSDYLASKEETIKKQYTVFDVIKNKAEASIKRNSLELQEQQAIRLLLLQQEETALKERLLQEKQ
jgi:transcriptional regulator with XRE-family HTH domain